MHCPSAPLVTSLWFVIDNLPKLCHLSYKFKVWCLTHMVLFFYVVFSDILDLPISFRFQTKILIILEKKKQITRSFCTFGTFCEDNSTMTLTLLWKLCIAALKLQPIKNSKTTEHHICPNPKLMSGSTRKVLLVSPLLSILPSVSQMCKHHTREAQLKGNTYLSGLAVSSSRSWISYQCMKRNHTGFGF